MTYQQFTPERGGLPPGQGRPGQGAFPPGMQGPGTGQRPPSTPSPGPGQRPPSTQGPGSGQRPPGMQGPGPGQRPPGMQGPGPSQRPPSMPGNQPPSAPPRFTPQLPREEEQQLFSDPSRSGGPFSGRIIDLRRRPRNFNNCLNRFTYVWLVNGDNFWFYPTIVRRNFVEGFRWRRNRWEYDRIYTNRVLFHSCF
ncbi:MAG: transporter [Clostridiales bacterium]|nr:transporter [Clostridiales bacterium]